MDDNHPKSLSARGARIDADAASADPASQRATAVYFSSAEEISDGFAIALRAMGFNEIFLSDLFPQSEATSNPEER
jgi:hypothetical protein